MVKSSEPVHSFTIKDDDDDPSLIWKILRHPGIYTGIIGTMFTICIGVYCFKIFCFRPSTPKHQFYSPVSSQHAIVDDDVDVAPIYRGGGMVEEPRRPHKNNDLHIEQEATRLESHWKQPALLKGVPISG